MSAQAQKKQSYKPKFEEKDKEVRKRYNFVFDEQQITYKTEIPELPTKLKPKPNADKFKDKIDQIQAKINSLKEQRREKKQHLKKGTQDFDKEIQKLQKNVELGKKCLIVLNYDMETIGQDLADVEQKIQKKARLLKNLQRGPREVKQNKKPYEEMTYQQLQAEEEMLSVRVSTANLNKKEQTEINALLSKLARMKLKAPHGEKPKDNTESIQNAHNDLNRFRVVKESLSRLEKETKNKIEAIEEDLEEFKDQIADLQEQKRNPEDEAATEECKQLKDEIYKLRDEVAKMQKEFNEKELEYDHEQAKVEWIKWATEIQKKKNQEWQAQRQTRRRQRLKEKEREKKGEGSQAGEAGKTEEDGKPERKRINRHQKQIDSCTFLISYCEGLIQKPEEEKKETQTEANKNIQQVLKSGEWSKMKDVQVVKSKKSNPDDEIIAGKIQKLKKKKVQKKETEDTAESGPITFNHQFFTVQIFDSVKVVPPTKPEQVENVLKELNDKLEYYLEHPEGTFSSEQRGQRFDKDRQKYTAQKYAKVKYNQRQKKVVNTEEFPSLH